MSDDSKEPMISKAGIHPMDFAEEIIRLFPYGWTADPRDVGWSVQMAIHDTAKRYATNFREQQHDVAMLLGRMFVWISDEAYRRTEQYRKEQQRKALGR